jgi:hypothetical protein
VNNNLHDLIIAYIDVLIGRGLTPYTLAKACRMNTGSFSRFRSRKYSPTLRVCNQIIERLELRIELYDCQAARIAAPSRAKVTVDSSDKTVDAVPVDIAIISGGGSIAAGQENQSPQEAQPR